MSAKLPTSYGNALAKFDMEDGTFKQWHEPGCIPVEPVMIPRPGAQACSPSNFKKIALLVCVTQTGPDIAMQLLWPKLTGDAFLGWPCKSVRGTAHTCCTAKQQECSCGTLCAPCST